MDEYSPAGEHVGQSCSLVVVQLEKDGRCGCVGVRCWGGSLWSSHMRRHAVGLSFSKKKKRHCDMFQGCLLWLAHCNFLLWWTKHGRCRDLEKHWEDHLLIIPRKWRVMKAHQGEFKDYGMFCDGGDNEFGAGEIDSANSYGSSTDGTDLKLVL